MEVDHVRVGAGIAGDHVQLRYRHVELVAAVVFQMQELGVALAEVHVDEAEVAADTVRYMHHRVADLQFRQVAQPALHGRRLACIAANPAAGGGGIELGLGEHRELCRGQHEAACERGDAECETRVGIQEGAEVGAGLGADLVFGEELRHRLAPAGRIGQQQHAAVEAGEEGLELVQRIGRLALDGDVGGWQRKRVGGGGRRFGGDRQARQVLQRDEEGFVGQEKLLGRQHRAGAVALEQVVARAGVLPELGDRARHVAVQQHRRVGRQVIEERRGVVEEQRQVVLDTSRGDAVGDVLVDRRPRRIALEGFAEAAAESRAALVVERELARRQQADLLGRIHRALRVGVEGLDALDLVIEEVDAEGQRRAHREQVDQPAAHRELARAHHLSHVGVAGECHLRLELVDVEFLALLEEEGVGGQVARRCQAVERGGGGHQHDVGLAAADRVERGQTLGDQVLVRRKAVVGQGFPVGQQVRAQARRGPGDLVQQALGVERVGGDHHQHAAAAGELGDGQRIGRAGERVEVEAGTGLGQLLRGQPGEEGVEGEGHRGFVGVDRTGPRLRARG